MNKTEMLQMFVASPDHYKPDITSAIRRGGYLYATNQYIAIRIPDDAEVVASETAGVPSLPKLFEHGEIEYHALPELPAPIECRKCGGTGKRYLMDCPDCDDGYFFHKGNEYECANCDGEGKVPADDKSNPSNCWYCSGSGEKPYSNGGAPLVKIGEASFQPRYLRLIAKLPNARISHAANKEAPAHFIFDGGIGVVMPCLV